MSPQARRNAKEADGQFQQEIERQDKEIILNPFWPWEHPAYSSNNNNYRTWASASKFQTLVKNMKIVYREQAWKEFEEKKITFI